MLNLNTAAERLGISRWTLRSWVRDRRIEVVKVGRRVFVDETVIAALIKKGQRPVLALRQRRRQERERKKKSSPARPRRGRHRTRSPEGERPRSVGGQHGEIPRQDSGQI